MSTGGAQARDLCSWCLEHHELQTIQSHVSFGRLQLCENCARVWLLWDLTRRAPAALRVVVQDSVLTLFRFLEQLYQSSAVQPNLPVQPRSVEAFLESQVEGQNTQYVPPHNFVPAPSSFHDALKSNR